MNTLYGDEFCSASWFRDLACVDGVLKFVEMENPDPPKNKDNVIYDSDLIVSLKRKAVDGDSMKQLSSFRDAWRAVTWSREVSSSSSNFWRQTCSAHVVDIKDQQLTFRDLYSAFPILSPEDGGDVLYLKSLVEPGNRDGWMAAVDIGNKALKAAIGLLSQASFRCLYIVPPSGYDSRQSSLGVSREDRGYKICKSSRRNLNPCEFQRTKGQNPKAIGIVSENQACTKFSCEHYTKSSYSPGPSC